jgi:beta-glucosidase/6-phospho-beta-glucosidase/beta-galactosidase
LSREVVDDFERYARVCYESFGDLVKFWFTINGEYIDLAKASLADGQSQTSFLYLVTALANTLQAVPQTDASVQKEIRRRSHI